MTTALDPQPRPSDRPDRPGRPPRPGRAMTRPEELGALGAIGVMGTRAVLAFRTEVFVSAIALLVRVVLVAFVWRAVYGERESVGGVARDAAVAYAVLGAIVGDVLNPWRFSNLQSRIREGRVASDLLRPVGLIPQTLAQQIGITVSALPRAIAAIALGLPIGALAVPASGAEGVIGFAVSLIAGLVIAMLMNLLVAMTAFWTTEIGGALMVYRAVAQFASGALIPLWFMPGWLRDALAWLPFQGQVFTPLSIFFGQTTGWALVGAIAGQLGWIALLAAIAQLVWTRALRKVVILGG